MNYLLLNFMRIIISVLILFLAFQILLLSEPNMNSARQLFYDAVKVEKKLEMGIKEFETIMDKNPKMKGIATTYIGSLTMLKGKHAFWPHKKIEYVNEGLEIMDKGLELDPQNLESLFIYGSTCYYLPFFLGKSKLADEKLKKMVSLLSDNSIAKYDSEIMSNALKFVIEKIKLSENEKNTVNTYLNKLSSK